MNSSVFGPIAWTILQSLPRLWTSGRGGEGAGKEVVGSFVLPLALAQSTNIIAYSIAVVLPCRYCRESYRRFIQYIDIRQWLQQPLQQKRLTADDFEFWLYLLHNMVNQKLHRRWERNKDAVYGGRVVEDERTYLGTLFDWFFILLMNYESMEPRDAAALKLIGKYAARRGTEWIDRANKHDVTLGALLEKQIFETVYDRDLCRGGTAQVAMSQTRWKKACWYVFHFAHMIQALEHVPTFSDRARRALALLEHYFVERADETLVDNKSAFARLYEVRCKYDPTCPSYEQTLERIESYKASDKSRDTSTAAAASAAEKH